MSPRSVAVWTMLLAFLTIQLWLYGTWIVDDAGITFAYARNFAAGHGWVSLPGEPAVEGFSNLLWALLLVPFLWLDVFDPVWTPKLLGVSCAFCALLLLRRALRLSHPRQPLWSDVGICLLAATPAFAIWSLSGLENGLYALLIAALLATSASATRVCPSWFAAIGAGLLAAMAAATRPDGLVFAALWPTTVLAAAPLAMRGRLRLAATASAATLCIVALVTLWRWQTFGDVVPNTFHAKVGSSWHRLPSAALLACALAIAQVLRWRWRARTPWVSFTLHSLFVFTALVVLGGRDITRALGGDLGAVLVAVTFGLAGGRPAVATAPWTIGAVLALFVHQSLPRDWMSEHRFGTPFFVAVVPWMVVELGAARAALTGRRRRLLDAALALALLAVLGRYIDRSIRFHGAPTVPMSGIEERHRVMASWARDLDLTAATALVPDVGGALWLGELRVMDLAGLCDAEIARRLGDPQRLAELILTDRRPTFIEFHHSVAHASGLLDAPRFRRDYVPIVEWPDEVASRLAGRPIVTGVYVRREHAPAAEMLHSWKERWR